jgi:predicted XRE-type DNA-binding protein
MQDNNDQVEFVRGSGNVFADLGLPNPEERQAKARLMHIINSDIQRRGLTQSQAAATTGLDQADISRIAHGRGVKFSTDRLIDVIRRLGMDVDLRIRHRADGMGTIEVHEFLEATA